MFFDSQFLLSENGKRNLDYSRFLTSKNRHSTNHDAIRVKNEGDGHGTLAPFGMSWAMAPRGLNRKSFREHKLRGKWRKGECAFEQASFQFSIELIGLNPKNGKSLLACCDCCWDVGEDFLSGGSCSCFSSGSFSPMPDNLWVSARFRSLFFSSRESVWGRKRTKWCVRCVPRNSPFKDVISICT